MKIFFLLLFVVVIDAGCKSKNSEVLPPKKMQALLWDMMRADQFLADYVLNKDTSINRITESLKHYQRIFAIHNVSKEEFQYSFSYYRNHPVLFKAIMDSINEPEKIIPVAPASSEPLTDSIIALPDTVNKVQIKSLPEAKPPSKKVRPVSY
ncbi:MAG: DUF4296 domain-containing protein [Chitinophagaceae bacterium]|nr:DUF4296 domain-containing protein [Chitinophagaceae bacterium]MBK9939697.1 DUF4296 domain-containing protein [Chitinophagaceae bacterium]